jgi:hypothetical protein
MANIGAKWLKWLIFGAKMAKWLKLGLKWLNLVPNMARFSSQMWQ